MKKSLFSYLALLACVIGLVGCGGSNSSTPAIQSDSSVVLIGDSITEGQGNPMNYPMWFAAWQPYLQVTNLGKSRATVQSWINDKYSQIATLNPKPKTAVVMLGTNYGADSYSFESYKKEYTALVERLIADQIKPIVVSVPPRPNIDNSDFVTRTITFNTWLKSYLCTTYNLLYIDVYSQLVGSDGKTQKDGYFVSDQIHPDVLGYQVIGKTIALNFPYQGSAWSLGSNLVPDPANQTTGTSNQLASGWKVTVSPDNSATYSLGLIKINNGGYWQQITKTAATSENDSVCLEKVCTPTAAIVSGAKYKIAVNIDTDGMATTEEIVLRFRWYDSSNKEISSSILLDRYSTSVENTRLWITETAPQNAAKFSIAVYLCGTGKSTVRLNQFSVNRVQ